MSGAAQQDLGPQLPSRTAVYIQATELHALARLAVEFSSAGPSLDIPRALVQFDRMRAILDRGDD